jgi:hypothetical protein
VFLLLFIQQTNGLKNQKRKGEQVKKNGKEELKKVRIEEKNTKTEHTKHSKHHQKIWIRIE